MLIFCFGYLHLCSGVLLSINFLVHVLVLVCLVCFGKHCFYFSRSGFNSFPIFLKVFSYCKDFLFLVYLIKLTCKAPLVWCLLVLWGKREPFEYCFFPPHQLLVLLILIILFLLSSSTFSLFIFWLLY